MIRSPLPFCRVLIVLFALFSASLSWSVSDVWEFETESQRERYQRFAEELRCPNCQGQNIAGSDSQVAGDLRAELYRLVMEGKSDEEIIDFMRQRYGDYILYRPQFQSNTYALWIGPLVILLIGFAVAAVILLKRKPRQSHS